MKIIKCLIEQISEELSDAEKYVDLAEKWKADNKEAADLFYELSTEEMGHVDKLHNEVKRIIEEYRTESGEPPREMMILYEYLHEQHIGQATRIKIKQGMYKA